MQVGYAKIAKMMNSWLSIDDWSANSHNNCDGGPQSATRQCMFITINVDDHGEEKSTETEFNCTQR